MRTPRILRSLMLICVAAACSLSTAAERPTAMRLFPSRTVFFLRAADGAELSEQFGRSVFGRMLEDPEVAPLARALWGEVSNRFEEGTSEVTGGMSLTKLLSLFSGETAFAVVSRPNKTPAMLLLVDTVAAADRQAGDRAALSGGAAELAGLIERLRSLALDNGYTFKTESIGPHELTVFREGDNADNAGAWVEHDGALLVGTDRDVMASVLARWDGVAGYGAGGEAINDRESLGRDQTIYADSLAENPSFSESLRECVQDRIGGDTSPPQLIGFVDPVGFFRSVAQDNIGLRVALATFPTLGLNGIEGASGAVWYGVGDWDSLMRGHLLLDNPRSGVLKMLRLAACDPTPGPAVPGDVVSYSVGAINLVATLDSAGALYDKIRGEGEFAKLVQDYVVTTIGVEPRVLLQNLTGRVATMTGFGDAGGEGPSRATPARATLFEVRDAERAQQELERVLGRFDTFFTWEEHAGTRYAWASFGGGPNAEQQRPGPPGGGVDFRGGVGWAVLGDSLVTCESEELLVKLIDTHEGRGDRRLADHLPFRLVINRSKRLGRAGASEGVVLNYRDSTAQVRRWVDFINSDEGRQMLDQFAEIAPPFRLLRDAIDETGVPPIETLLRYVSPGGSVLYDTPTGFRYVAFQFRRD